MTNKLVEPMSQSHEASGSIKAVAIYEVVKGLGAITTAIALWTWHTELTTWLISVNGVGSDVLGGVFATQIDGLTEMAERAAENWRLFMFAIFAYASVRFMEAYGLWQDKTWAYWVSFLGYGVFIPVELYYLFVRPFDWFNLAILATNILVVIVVYRQMRQKGLI